MRNFNGIVCGVVISLLAGGCDKDKPLNVVPQKTVHGQTTAQTLSQTSSVFDAILKGDVESVNVWAKSAEDINLRWDKSISWVRAPTALQLAAMLDKAEICGVLIANGAKIEPDDPFGSDSSALAIACGERGMSAAKLLIAKGAKVDHQDENGFTPLMYSSMGGNAGNNYTLQGRAVQKEQEKLAEPFVRLLLEANANVFLQTRAGLTAEEMARQFGFTNIASLLQQHALLRKK